MDINKVLLTGIADSHPILTSLPQSNTQLCHFTLRVEEQYVNAHTGRCARANYFLVEGLGKQAGTMYQRVKQGGRYLIDGYLRQEYRHTNRKDIVKIRCYGVIEDHNDEAHSYHKGIEKALSLMATSPDLKSAIATLEEILGNV